MMTREKLIKKGKRMKRTVTLLNRLRPAPHLIGTERFIETSLGKVRVLEYGFDSPETAPLYIDMHGGGFIFMSADMDEAINLFFKERTGVKIVSVDYPKAPEFPYPAAVNAVYEIVCHYIDNAAMYRIDPSRVGIGGHSAGANLTTVTCMRAKAEGGLSFRFQLLDYPPLDLYTDPFAKPKPKNAIPPRMAAAFNACYVDSEMAKEPYVSPVFSSKEQLTGLPSALLIVAGHDSLHDEGVRYGEMLKNAGVSVEFHEFAEAAHGFTYKKTEDARKAQEMMAAFISCHI